MANPPLDNYHCFKGMGLAYWRDKAIGLQPTGTKAGPQGHQITYVLDPDDGFAMQNGGIANPHADIIHQRPMIRFMRTGQKAERGLSGNWWIDLDAYTILSGYALNHKITLAEATQTLLVVPKTWSDCGQMLVARPNVPLMVYRGKGRAVALIGGKDTSPDAARRPGTELHVAPPGTNLEQIYIPGEPQFLSAWLTLISVHHADRGGGAFPAL